MTFDKFYETVLTISGIDAPKEYIKILWVHAYTIDQAVHHLQTMNDE
jgi:hypothetical protein